MTGTRPEESGGDYSYDLAHEAVGAGTPSEEGPDREPPVTTDAASDEAGDYSYDLAHDIPRQGE